MLIDGNELRDAPPVRETDADRVALRAIRQWWAAHRRARNLNSVVWQDLEDLLF